MSSIVAHLGEEPVISGETGICNVFYTHCNLKCRFCQNHQISQPGKNTPFVQSRSLETVLEEIEHFLSQGITHVGFVSPGHFIPQT
ncbi:MAG: radical SAM protein, partial [Phototrophicales bacterium]